MVFDPQLLIEIFKRIVVELLSIVRDEDPRDSEAAYDTFPDETLDIFLHDRGQRFCLDPFGEVVDPYDKELEPSYRHGEGSYYVQPLLGEWPEGIHWC